MLKKRIIPVLLIKNKTLIKDKQFAKNRRVGSLLPAIKIYNNRQVDELILLDIQATNNNRCIDASLINEISKSAFFPFCVGGGINNCESTERYCQNSQLKKKRFYQITFQIPKAMSLQ